MFLIWLVGLALAVLAPVALALAVWRLSSPETRPAAARALLGGLIGAGAGLVFSSTIAFVAERRATFLGDYWYAQAAVGFTLGVAVALIVVAWRAARERVSDDA